jgi:ubiquinone/menaquinone biosynthesis C-methylase UbiE
MTEVLLGASAIAPGSSVLDLASGSGEPALTIASFVGASGRVTASDLSAGMLAIAEEKCRGAENICFEQADAHDLPFTDEYFDVVTCRLGVMYFWDCQRALREILRVLKPDGHATFVAWGGLDQNRLARTVITPFANRRQPPQLPAGAPHPLRFAETGSLAT